MFKIKHLNQQRASFKPIEKSMPFEDFLGLEKYQEVSAMDSLLLARFLSTAGPEEPSKESKMQSNKATRMLNKLCKKPSCDEMKLVHSSLRDSGVYSCTSEKETILSLQDFQFPQPPVMPHRSVPVPPADNRTTPEGAAVISAFQQNILDSQKIAEDKKACPHCRQSIKVRVRRPSCPPALASGPKIEIDAKRLLNVIEQLKNQLAEEKKCRMKLERAMYQIERREQLEKEKSKWVNDCMILNDRLALLPN